MGKNIIRFCEPITPSMRKVTSLLKDSFQTGKLSNFGPNYSRLKNLLVDYLDLSPEKDLLIVSSGHTALMVAYKALQVKKLVIPTYTFESTRCAATFQGMEPVLLDVSSRTGSLDLELLKRQPINSYDAVCLVCPISVIPDIKAVQDFCLSKKKKLIVDGAATFGTRGIFNYGDCFCLSFHATKTFPIGEGGAIIFNKKDRLLIESLINFGFDEERNVISTGMNAKISDYNCAVGVSLFEEGKLDSLVEKKLEVSDIYKKNLSDFALESSIEDTVYQTFPVYLPSKKKALLGIKALKNEGIDAKQYYRPLNSSIEATSLFNRSICLPVHKKVSSRDAKKICEIVLSVC